MVKQVPNNKQKNNLKSVESEKQSFCRQIEERHQWQWCLRRRPTPAATTSPSAATLRPSARTGAPTTEQVTSYQVTFVTLCHTFHCYELRWYISMFCSNQTILLIGMIEKCQMVKPGKSCHLLCLRLKKTVLVWNLIWALNRSFLVQ